MGQAYTTVNRGDPGILRKTFGRWLTRDVDVVQDRVRFRDVDGDGVADQERMGLDAVCDLFKLDRGTAAWAATASNFPFSAIDAKHVDDTVECQPLDLLMAAVLVCRGTVNDKLSVVFDTFAAERAATLRPEDLGELLKSFVRATEAVSRYGLLSELSDVELHRYITDAFCSAGKGHWSHGGDGVGAKVEEGPNEGAEISEKEFKRWVKEVARRPSHDGEIGCAVGLCLSQAVKFPPLEEPLPPDPRHRKKPVRPFLPKHHMELTQEQEEKHVRDYDRIMKHGTTEESRRRFARLEEIMAESPAHTRTHHAFEQVRLKTYSTYHVFGQRDHVQHEKLMDRAKTVKLCSELDESTGAWLSNLRTGSK